MWSCILRVAFYPSLPHSLALRWCDVSCRISQRWQEGLQYANAASRYVFFGESTACVLTRVPLHSAQRRANFGPSPCLSIMCACCVSCQIIVPACIRWILMFLERFLNDNINRCSADVMKTSVVCISTLAKMRKFFADGTRAPKRELFQWPLLSWPISNEITRSARDSDVTTCLLECVHLASGKTRVVCDVFCCVRDKWLRWRKRT